MPKADLRSRSQCDVRVRASSPAVEPELDRRSAGTYFPAMDGYRAVAALAVLLAHVALLSGIVRTNTTFGPYLARADVGVSVFFLLSGFLLYRPFVAARLAGRPSGSLGGYVRRRALRIIPAYWFALTIVAFVLEGPGLRVARTRSPPTTSCCTPTTSTRSPGAPSSRAGPSPPRWPSTCSCRSGRGCWPAGTAPRPARSGSR